jgi:hypothetical protein
MVRVDMRRRFLGFALSTSFPTIRSMMGGGIIAGLPRGTFLDLYSKSSAEWNGSDCTGFGRAGAETSLPLVAVPLIRRRN